MPAPNLKTLHNFLENFEQAVKVGLSEDFSLTAYTSRDQADPDTELPDEMLSITLAETEAVEVREVPDVTGNPAGMEWGGYEAGLLFVVRTLREDDEPNVAEIRTRHADILSTVRAAMTYQSALLTGVRLPYYEIVELQPGREAFEMDDEVRVDITSLPYTVRFYIRQDAWPV